MMPTSIDAGSLDQRQEWHHVIEAARRAGAGYAIRKVAVVVQRFGSGLVGGAEWHARALITALSQRHDVTVLTSCAEDARTWAMHFEPGETRLDNLRIRRFEHPQRNAGGRARVPRRHKLRLLCGRVFDLLGRPRVAKPCDDERLDGLEFLRRQGPLCARLVAELESGGSNYDAVIFFTALYFPTALGLPAWGGRSVLVPTLHDEKAMYLPWFHRVFTASGTTLYNTASEQDLARRLYGASAGKGRVVGAGVHVQHPGPVAVREVHERFAIPFRYIVYVGRIEKGKGCGELLKLWLSVAGQVPDAALVFVGRGQQQMPSSPQVLCTGFVTNAERDALIADAAALIVPSRFESLSLVLLEALALGVPAVVNARCDVLAAHIAASGAGDACGTSGQWRLALLRALSRTPDERRRLGAAGQRYVAAHYSWDAVCASWFDAVERVCTSRSP